MPVNASELNARLVYPEWDGVGIDFNPRESNGVPLIPLRALLLESPEGAL
jgi:hypothetical protein